MIPAIILSILAVASTPAPSDLLTPVVYVSQQDAVWVGLRNESDSVQFVCINSVTLSVSRDGGVEGSGAVRSPHNCNSIEDSFALATAGVLAVSIPGRYLKGKAACRIAINASVGGNHRVDKHTVCAAAPLRSWTRDPAALSVEAGADNEGSAMKNLSDDAIAVALRRNRSCSDSSVLLLPHSRILRAPLAHGKTTRKDYVLVDARNRCKP
jgi:hypothetical protein